VKVLTTHSFSSKQLSLFSESDGVASIGAMTLARGSGSYGAIFSNGPNIIFECSNLLY
jgi:hypothetical protein